MTTHLQKLPAEALSAEERASRSVKINENYALLYNDIAQYLYQQKEYKDAVKIFQEAKKFKIDDVGILCNIGDCALVGWWSLTQKLGSLEEAGDWYNQAFELSKQRQPTNTETLKQVHARQGNLFYEKARRCFNRGQYAESLSQVNKALEHHVTKDKLHLKANVHMQLLEPQRAADVYRDILLKDPRDAEANAFVGQFMLK